MKRYCLALDLKDDPELIAEYKKYHEDVWPEIRESLRDAGVLDMEIYAVGTRLFMIMETEDSFTFEAKAKSDRENPRVQEWEQLMWKFQKALPSVPTGEKWALMERIFKLS